MSNLLHFSLNIFHMKEVMSHGILNRVTYMRSTSMLFCAVLTRLSCAHTCTIYMLLCTIHRTLSEVAYINDVIRCSIIPWDITFSMWQVPLRIYTFWYFQFPPDIQEGDISAVNILWFMSIRGVLCLYEKHWKCFFNTILDFHRTILGLHKNCDKN